MTLTISVTQDDIDHGVAADCRDCPVARAIGRTVGATVTVGAMAWAVLDDPQGFIEYPLPLWVQHWIPSFDNAKGIRFRPFTFTITIPDTDPVAVKAMLAELELTARGD